MGYILVENFSKKDTWKVGIPSNDVYIGEIDWPELMSSPKDKSMSIEFYDVLKYPNYIEKVYEDYLEFVTQDALDTAVQFEELVLTVWARFKFEKAPHYTRAEYFHTTLALYDNDKKLIEWFIPLKDTVGYEQIKFDMLPLIHAGVKKFNKIRINILKESIGTQIYLGDLYLFQDDVEHNIKVSLAKMLHMSLKKKISSVKKHASIGDTSIHLNKYTDIAAGTPIIIGEKNYELHIVANSPNSKSPLTFTDMYDGKSLASPFPVNTPVYETCVSAFGDLSQTEQFFSVYYITTKSPQPVEERSNITTRFDSYIRDPLGNHKVSVRKSIDTTVVQVEIHIYATTSEKASDLWRHLKSLVDNQSFIQIAGEDVQYEVMSYDQLSQDPDITESMPHYVMNLNCYVWENVHKRSYGKFPYFKMAEIDIDSVPFQSVEFRKKLT